MTKNDEIKFADLKVGDYSGSREYLRDRDYFLSTFIEPPNFGLKSLKNSENFIVVGGKGTGKSSCCFSLADERRSEGFNSTFYNFTDDLTKVGLRDAVQTQVIELKAASVEKLMNSISEFYDFRELWKRKVYDSIFLRQFFVNASSYFSPFIYPELTHIHTN